MITYLISLLGVGSSIARFFCTVLEYFGQIFEKYGLKCIKGQFYEKFWPSEFFLDPVLNRQNIGLMLSLFYGRSYF